MFAAWVQDSLYFYVSWLPPVAENILPLSTVDALPRFDNAAACDGKTEHSHES